MNPVIIIPARLESTRMPKKMLRDDTGKPLIVHTVENALRSDLPVYVATDSGKIMDVVNDTTGAEACFTLEAPSGSDRIWMAFQELVGYDLIINLQGDEPEIDPSVFGKLVKAMGEFPRGDMATLSAPLTLQGQNDPNVVKVRTGLYGMAKQFSRGPLTNAEHHVGVYAYSPEFLRWFVARGPSDREKRFGLEQLRALDAGCRIRVVKVRGEANGIDTEDEYRSFVARERYRQNEAGRCNREGEECEAHSAE